MRLRRRITLLFAVMAALLLLGVAMTAYVEQRRTESSDDVRTRLQPARDEVTTLLVSLVDQEAGQRGYLLTRDPSFLEPYELGVEQVNTSIRELRRLAEGYPDLRAAIERVRSRMLAWEQLGADFEIRVQQAGGEEVTAGLVRSGTSRRLFQQAHDELLATRRLVDRAIADELGDSRRWSNLLDAVLAVNVVAALGVLVVARGLVGRWVTQPIATLAGSVRRVSSGALREPIAVEGPPDVVALGGDVEAMRRRLLAEVDDATRAREALADRGMIVVTLRDELAASEATVPEGLGFAARFRPARGLVAGDWYDTRQVEPERLALALVDVAGHGASVAAFALRTKALTMAVLGERDPGGVLGWVAGSLGETGELFLTAAVVEVDVDGAVRYASGGHPPMLLGSITGVTELPPTGPVVGPFPGAWATASVTLERGGVLVAYSDGLIEARDETGTAFGVDRLADVVAEHQLSGAEAVAQACVDAVERFAGAELRDDVTIVAVSR